MEFYYLKKFFLVSIKKNREEKLLQLKKFHWKILCPNYGRPCKEDAPKEWTVIKRRRMDIGRSVINKILVLSIDRRGGQTDGCRRKVLIKIGRGTNLKE